MDTRVNYCVFCKKGTYQNAEAQITCVDCPRGYTTENDGNYDVDQCSGRFTVRVSHIKRSIWKRTTVSVQMLNQGIGSVNVHSIAQSRQYDMLL